MGSPPLARQTLLFPFYSNDSLTPFLTISLAPKAMILYNPAQPSISHPTPARTAHICLSLLIPLPEFMLIDDDDAKGRQ